MRTIYFELSSGISGDMAAAALIDLGVSEEYLLGELSKLNIGGYSVDLRKEKKQAISGLRMNVITEETCRERHHKDITDIIDASSLNENVKRMSKKMFEVIAMAESKVHDIDIGEVHFHEVGAIDSIIDIVAVSVCIDYLKPDRIISSYVRTGKGHVKCGHGILPVPAPATLEILKGVPIYSGGTDGEMVTPTGAAIIKCLADGFEDFHDLRVARIGYGIGKKDFEHANVLRVFLSEDDDSDKIYVIETNIDDMNPELYDSVINDLFDKGALDVCMQPVIMKKQRPGVLLSVLCNGKNRNEMELAILAGTSTYGVRTYEVQRRILDRETEVRETRLGNVIIKKGYLDGKLVKEKIEYEDLKRLSKETGKPILEILRILDRDGIYGG